MKLKRSGGREPASTQPAQNVTNIVTAKRAQPEAELIKENDLFDANPLWISNQTAQFDRKSASRAHSTVKGSGAARLGVGARGFDREPAERDESCRLGGPADATHRIDCLRKFGGFSFGWNCQGNHAKCRCTGSHVRTGCQRCILVHGNEQAGCALSETARQA